MMIFTILGVFIISTMLIVFNQKASTRHEKFILNFIYFALLFVSLVVLTSEFAGSDWHPLLQISAFVFIAVYWIWQILKSSFWGIIFFQACLVLHFIVGGYLYSATQIPYDDEPFIQISNNQPHELNPGNFPHHWISGLPIAPGPLLDNDGEIKNEISSEQQNEPLTTQLTQYQLTHFKALNWNNLRPLMVKDSQIRTVLQNLKEQQERELSDMLAQLNAISVASTNMRRRALSAKQINNLLQERAISKTRHRTFVETWRLLDSDEQAFRRRQEEDRFHALLELMEDEKIDETHKVEFINFMVKHFSDDVRLIKPLIKIYDRLDSDYPRQKRLNKAFLDLYIARCNALLNGFAKIGQPAVQPLLDYRNHTISEITYSLARLDKFIDSEYGIKVYGLYKSVEPVSVPDFLNRRKYPIAEKLAGASFKQDYIRRNILQTMFKNNPAKFGQAVMGFSEQQYQQIKNIFEGDAYVDQIDYLVIDPNPDVRGNLAWYLAERKDPYFVPLIFELMRDSSPEVRRLAAIAIGNFKIVDTQGSNDPKFIEILKMLQNYRSNSDAFGRAWALLSLSNIADKQKALYVIDLILNDGSGYHSSLGSAAPTWRSDEEQHVIKSLVETLEKTPEEFLVKTYALNSLIAINSSESLGILLQYLHHIYETHDSRPSMWRYFMPHLTLPQEAENVEDLIVYLAKAGQSGHKYAQNRHLKALNEYLRKSYESDLSGEYFQLLRFLKVYDETEYSNYLNRNDEQIRIMRIREYFYATHLFWLFLWPISLLIVLFVNYLLLPFLNLSAPKRSQLPNFKSNPAADTRQQNITPAPTIVPVKISNQK